MTGETTYSYKLIDSVVGAVTHFSSDKEIKVGDKVDVGPCTGVFQIERVRPNGTILGFRVDTDI